jgi:hypothetical protein
MDNRGARNSAPHSVELRGGAGGPREILKG